MTVHATGPGLGRFLTALAAVEGCVGKCRWWGRWTTINDQPYLMFDHVPGFDGRSYQGLQIVVSSEDFLGGIEEQGQGLFRYVVEEYAPRIADDHTRVATAPRRVNPWAEAQGQ